MAIYNKMRPKSFNEVFGQENVVKILKKSMVSGNIPNAMLFVGTRGTGKTTCARIVAKALNCHNPKDGECCNECPSCKAVMSGNNMDVIELDAASNNGVDNIRDILEQVALKPVEKYKVVILDEVHMLSNGAFNALLKVLEEPPKNVLFILCTTEAHKIPATIVSRCRKFQFDTISESLIVSKLNNICSTFGYKAEDGALLIIARAAKGSMRDAESIFENFIDTDGVITEATVRKVLGFSNEDLIFQVLNGIKEGTFLPASYAIDEVMEKGGSIERFLEDIIRVLMDAISIHLGGDLSGMPQTYLEKASNVAFSFSSERLFEICKGFQNAYEKKNKYAFLVTVMSLVNEECVISSLERRVEELETKVSLLLSSNCSQNNIGNAVCSENIASKDFDNKVIVPDELSSDSPSVAVDIPHTVKAVCDVAPADIPAEETQTEKRPSPELSSEDLDALANLGFTVLEDSPFDAPGAEQQDDVPIETVVTDDEPPAETSETCFFDEWARLFE